MAEVPDADRLAVLASEQGVAVAGEDERVERVGVAGLADLIAVNPQVKVGISGAGEGT